MNPKIFSLMAATAITLTGPASALERSGKTTINIDGRQFTQDFTTQFDPATGALSRKGTITLANGRKGSYDIRGTCKLKPISCELTGTGKGPYGRPWTGTGTVNRVGTRFVVKAELKGPGGATIKFDREVDGDNFQGLGLETP